MDFQLIADAWLQEDKAVLDTLPPAQLRAVGLIAAGVPDDKALEAAGTAFVCGMKATTLVRQVGGATIEKAPTATKENTLPWVFSDEKPDRAGDIILQSGWQLANYKRNPVVLWGHANGIDSEADIPIGRATNVRVDGGKLVGEIEFAVNESERAARIYRLASAGYIKAGSVGFRPLKVNHIAEESERNKLGLGRWGVVFEKQELLEFSLCAVPCNPGALQLSVKSGAITEADADVVRGMSAPTERDEVSVLRRRARAAIEAITALGAARTNGDSAGDGPGRSGGAISDDALRGFSSAIERLSDVLRSLSESQRSSAEDDSASRRMLARAITDLGARVGATRGVDSSRSVADAAHSPEPVDLSQQLTKLNELLAGFSGGKN